MQFKKSHKPWNKGKSLPALTKDHKEMISAALKGRKQSKETKHKISKANKGHAPWHKSIIGIPVSSQRDHTGRFIEGSSPWSAGKKRPEISGDLSPQKRQDVRDKKSTAMKGKEPWNKGIKGIYSEEYKNKLSKARSGKKASDETRKKQSAAKLGKLPWNKGIPCSDTTKLRLSITNKGREAPWEKGEKNHQWKGGISFIPYCPKFNFRLKEHIRERDNRTCQLCGCSEKENHKRLPVHHVHYDKPNCEPDLISLCTRCNAIVNSNRNYYETLFMEKLRQRGLIK